MSSVNFEVISQVITSVKNQNQEVIRTKAALKRAELSAVYGDQASTALMDAAAQDVFRRIVIKEGGKWDNAAQCWDSKGRAVLKNLETAAKDGDGYYYNWDAKSPVILDTEARAESFGKALRKEYIRRRRDGQNVRERKDLDERIMATYKALEGVLAGELLISAVAGALKCTSEKVKEVING